MNKFISSLILIISLAGFSSTVSAQSSLDDLLATVKKGSRVETQENRDRIAKFKADLDKQKELLSQAKAELAAEAERSKKLEKNFADNEIVLAELEELLEKRLGQFGELFGVVRQVAGDTRGHISQSLISAQYPGRTKFLGQLAERKELPKIEELEQLWYTMTQEMTEQGKVVKFKASITNPGGEATTAEVIRIGPFTGVVDGQYVRYLADREQVQILPRQPGQRLMTAAASISEASSGYVPAAIDPSRGALLGLLVQAPSLQERFKDGGVVGQVIAGVAAIGVLFGLFRIIILSLTSVSVAAQKRSDAAKEGNPLGRVMTVYEANKSLDVESLELKLDEAILKETPKFEAGLSTIKVLAAIAPMLGLLGTVTGMIETFQMITLFGTGDPKLMAGGISMALVTTVLGLIAAIPLLLIHSFAQSRARALTNVLEEQSAGLIAERAEAA